MFTQIVFTVFGILIGIAFCCVGCLVWDNDDKKRRKEIVRNEDGTNDWCEKNCKCYEYYFSNYEDPDDAFKELDSKCCSNGCPLIEAQLLLFREEYRNK